MTGAFWQNPKFQKRYQTSVTPAATQESPTPEATALYAANAAAAAARAEESATTAAAIIGFDTDGNAIIKLTLPTEDPATAGVLWDNGGFLMVSQG